MSHTHRLGRECCKEEMKKVLTQGEPGTVKGKQPNKMEQKSRTAIMFLMLIKGSCVGKLYKQT